MKFILHVHVYVVVNFSSQVIFFVFGYVNECYCETRKTMNTRNIHAMLLCCVPIRHEITNTQTADGY